MGVTLPSPHPSKVSLGGGGDSPKLFPFLRRNACFSARFLGEYPPQESPLANSPNQIPPGEFPPGEFLTQGIDRGELTSGEYDWGELAEGNSPGGFRKWLYLKA